MSLRKSTEKLFLSKTATLNICSPTAPQQNIERPRQSLHSRLRFTGLRAHAKHAPPQRGFTRTGHLCCAPARHCRVLAAGHALAAHPTLHPSSQFHSFSRWRNQRHDHFLHKKKPPGIHRAAAEIAPWATDVHGALLVGRANLPQTAWDMSQGLRGKRPASFSNCASWPDPVDRNHHGRRQHRGQSPRSHWVCTPRSHPAMPPPKSIRAVFSYR